MNARIRLEYVLLKYFSGTEDVSLESAGDLEKLQVEALVDAFAHELAEEIRDEAWPHERDERENQLIYKLAVKIDPYEETK